ncbi:MAG: hypothetical protein J3K34DRAFT_8476 [Monoraphidium minutum]|nr:MAG: hypothetical protein J3K34DRAFT_8476 [Monoraphidium minutum]
MRAPQITKSGQKTGDTPQIQKTEDKEATHAQRPAPVDREAAAHSAGGPRKGVESPEELTLFGKKASRRGSLSGSWVQFLFGFGCVCWCAGACWCCCCCCVAWVCAVQPRACLPMGFPAPVSAFFRPVIAKQRVTQSAVRVWWRQCGPACQRRCGLSSNRCL